MRSQGRGVTRVVGLNDRKVEVRVPVDDPFSVLPENVRAELKSRWRRPCEDLFSYLAERHPDTLLLLIEKGDMAPADLTYAAELAGRIVGSQGVLLRLLADGSPVVREGAIYGLAERLAGGVSGVREKLLRVASRDPSPAVRAAAAAVLTP